MTVHVAVDLMERIDMALRADQGASYRGHLKEILPQINDAYRTEKEDFRSHLGASGIGKECARAIWYGFRWHTKSSFEGRMIRLFNRGHLEEGRILALLKMIGVKYWQQDDSGKQFTISGSHGHYGGSGDGVGMGIPGLKTDQPVLLEFKTHNDASFKKLKDVGVYEAKFEHYIQMQQYERKMNLPIGLYVAINKNTDELYAEFVPLDAACADRFIQRADKIVWMKQPPKKISESAGFFKCRFCEHKPVCHLQAEPSRNCRSCQFSYPAADKQWGCSKFNVGLTKETQLAGCKDWTRIVENKDASEAA